MKYRRPDIEIDKRERAEAIYSAFLAAIDAFGHYPRFRAEVIEECGKAFERFLEKHCKPESEAKP